jgi:hypothetical protein
MVRSWQAYRAALELVADAATDPFAGELRARLAVAAVEHPDADAHTLLDLAVADMPEAVRERGAALSSTSPARFSSATAATSSAGDLADCAKAPNPPRQSSEARRHGGSRRRR